jgi:acyl carrier protein
LDKVKYTIDTVLEDIRERNAYPKTELKEDCKVVQHLGFSSLDVAELIALLELELGVDPFSEGVSIMEVHTIGELYRVYREVLEQEIALETQ